MLPEQLSHVVEDILAKDKTLEKVVPPRPEEPLPQDCCGNSCEPCVFDMYRQELDHWGMECLKILRPDMVGGDVANGKENVVPAVTELLEPNEYREFKIKSITPISKDTSIYRFELPKTTVLNLPVGKHLILRCFTVISLHFHIALPVVCRGTTKAQAQVPKEVYVTRQYTPVSPVDQVGSFDLMIKVKYPRLQHILILTLVSVCVSYCRVMNLVKCHLT